MAAPYGPVDGRFLVLILVSFVNCSTPDQFTESLLIKPLNSGHVISQFDFIINTDDVSGRFLRLHASCMSKVSNISVPLIKMCKYYILPIGMHFFQ